MKAISRLVLLIILFANIIPCANDLNDKDEILFTAMEQEITRSMKGLKIKKDKPYYILCTIDEMEYFTLSATLGYISIEDERFSRKGAAIVKVGNYKYDNSIYKSKRKNYDWEISSRGTIEIPIDNDITVIRHKLWLLLDGLFKKSVDEYTVKKETEGLEVKKKNELPDYTRHKGIEYFEKEEELILDRNKWKKILKNISLKFKECPLIENSDITLSAFSRNAYTSDSEKLRMKKCMNLIEISISATATSKDNIPVRNGFTVCAYKEEQLPDEEKLREKVNEIIKDIKEKCNAEVLESYIGPVVLEAGAAAKFFAEVLGENLLADRRSYENDRLILINRKDRRITSRDISIIADSNEKYFEGQPLINYHHYDDEGVKTRKVSMIENGIMRNYLTTRRPIKGFDESNGYAIFSAGWRAVMNASPGNLFVEVKNALTNEELKDKMIEMCNEYRMPYGIIIKGFDVYYRSNNPMVTIYNVDAVKIDVKTREETPVYGFNIPSASFLTLIDKIIYAGNERKVYNGAGTSCVSPAIFIEEIEIKEDKDLYEKPPILKSPLK